MSSISVIEKAINQGRGVVRLAPAWVPRSFCRPGRRLRLHPDDYFALGLERGGIDERWFSSTTPADNGPGTPEDEGLSYIVTDDGKEKALLIDAVGHLKGGLIGGGLFSKYGKWPIYSKFFDNKGPLPHHIHHDDEHAALVSASGPFVKATTRPAPGRSSVPADAAGVPAVKRALVPTIRPSAKAWTLTPSTNNA